MTKKTKQEQFSYIDYQGKEYVTTLTEVIIYNQYGFENVCKHYYILDSDIANYKEHITLDHTGENRRLMLMWYKNNVDDIREIKYKKELELENK